MRASTIGKLSPASPHRRFGEHHLTAKEKLIRAAVKVFSDKGFSGASTREIARRARVNPVTLFRTFNSKEQLHAAAVDYLISGLQVRKQIDALAERSDPAPQFIAAAVKIFIDVNFSTPEFQRILLNAALERSEIAFPTVWDRLVPILQRLQGHLSNYMTRGELRKTDPMVVARLIVAAAVFHYQLYELFGGKKIPELNQADLSGAYADVLYAGLKP